MAARPRQRVDHGATDRAQQRLANTPGGEWVFADRLGDMISTHAPDGTFRYVSRASRELLGYEPDELVGTWAYDHFHPDDVPRIGVAHRSVLAGSPFTVTYRLRHKDGGYVWVETNNRVVTSDRTGEVVEILCCTREISHRKSAAEMDQRERDARFRRVESVLANETIEPVFQPIVELESERVIAYEALSRFPGNPGHTPDRWFQDAWGIGLGIPLELLATRRAAAAALPRLPRDVSLSINASPPAVAAHGFLRSIGGCADRVAIEITEHLHVGDYEAVRGQLLSVREAGGQVAIDDFGAGYASLQHILEVGPEWIKLDISLTKRIGGDPLAQALATALVSFAEETRVCVVAEGIETAEELKTLSGLGIRFGQGFHLGRPERLEKALLR